MRKMAQVDEQIEQAGKVKLQDAEAGDRSNLQTGRSTSCVRPKNPTRFEVRLAAVLTEEFANTRVSRIEAPLPEGMPDDGPQLQRTVIVGMSAGSSCPWASYSRTVTPGMTGVAGRGMRKL